MKTWLRDFQRTCQSIGVKQGDLLYISSDITMMMYRISKNYNIRTKEAKNEFLHRFVDCIKDLVGEQGTLLIPMFTWSFCKGIAYDVRKTLGEVGFLGNWILENRPDFKRTAHPLYSFMVTGRDAKLLCDMDNVIAWGEDSPFAYLHHHKGKNLLFNVSLERCFTFTHYVEQCLKVPYRYFKEFNGDYVNEVGVRSNRTYMMFVRDLNIKSKQVTPEECLDQAGVAVTTEYDHNRLKLVELDKAYPVVADNYLYHNGSDWYEFDDYVIDWEKGQTHPDHYWNPDFE